MSNLSNLYLPEEGMSEQQLASLLQRRGQTLATPIPQDTTGQTADLLLFTLTGEQYAVPLAWVQSIHPYGTITPVPRTPSFLLGLFNARGRLRPVVDLARFLRLTAVAHPPSGKIIIVEDEASGIETGLLVDEVLDIITRFKADLNPPLPTQDNYRAQFTQAVSNDMITILDLARLLNDPHFIIHEEL